MKTNHIIQLNLCLLFILGNYENINAQESFNGFSINPQIGVYYNANPEDGGFLAGLQLNKFKNQTIYSVDYFRFAEFTLMDPIPDNSYNQLGLMIGKYNHHEVFRLLYQGGVAPFFGKMYSEDISGDPGTPDYEYYSTDKFFTVGLLGKLGFRLILTKNIALSADFHVNLNLKQSLFFPSVGLEIGKQRD